MKTYTTRNHLMAAGAALAVAAGTQVASAALLVDVDLRGLGSESSAVTNIANAGTLGGTFDAVGTGATVSTVGGVQALSFADNKYNSSVNSPLTGNASYSATAWVYNSDIAGEEAIVAWGARGRGDGGNSSLHQGTSGGGGGFGAVGHWGGDFDVAWGDDGMGVNDITATTDSWTHLAWSYDSASLTESVYINGELSNAKTFPGALNVYGPVPFGLGAEHTSGDPTDTTVVAVPFSGLIGSVKVWDEPQDQAAIQADFAQGIPEPSGAAMTMLGLLSFLGLRRRK